MKSIVISSSSSWSLWKFRSFLLQKLSKKFDLVVFSKEKKFLNKIKIKNLTFQPHNITKTFVNIFFLKKKKIRYFIEYDIKNLLFHCIAKLFLNYNLTVIWAGLGSYYNKKGYFSFLEILILKILFLPVNKLIFINKYDKEIIEKYKIFINNFLIKTEGCKIKIAKKKIYLKKNYKFVLSARPIIEKGIIEYIKVAKINPNHKFYYYLIGNNKKEIFYNSKKININLLNIPKNFFIKKQVTNFKNELKKYDCLISASYGEGFGATISDAVCVGVNVISTRTNGAKYIFRKKSLLWCSTKSIKDLNMQIKKFLNLSKKSKLNFIKNAQQDILKTDQQIIIKKLMKLIM